MNEAIQSSFDYIISDCEKSINSLEIQFYGDIFKLLKLSYTEIAYNEIFKKSNINPLDVLNSTEILYQFIIFYVSYLSVNSYNEFTRLFKFENAIIGGGETPEEENPEEENPEESVSPLIKEVTKERTEVPEYVFITHNNLLTTITR